MELSAEDIRLVDAVERNDADAAATVQQAIRDGANVNAVRRHSTPLLEACGRGYHEIIRILLDAGADARWMNEYGWSAITAACHNGHLSTVQLLINYDNGLLKTVDDDGWTPLTVAIHEQHSDVVRFLLASGADPHHADESGRTALMYACRFANLEIVQLLLAAGADVEARDDSQRTALHHAADSVDIETMRELILQHNANMFAADEDGDTPFDLACNSEEQTADVVDNLLAMYCNKLIQEHGQLALHELMNLAEYSFAEDEEFHPPLNPLQVILPLGKLTLKHFHTLLHASDPELIRSRDRTRKLPIHIACRTNAPVEVLTYILELDPAVLHIADYYGSLPIHLLCDTPVTTDSPACDVWWSRAVSVL